MLIYGSLQSGFMVGPGEFTLANYIEAYSDREFYSLFLNSFIYAIGVSIFTFLIGTILAWVCERTNTPGRKLFAVLAVAAYIIPGVLLTISWILLLSPRIGLLNNLLTTLFGLAESPLTIYSYWGMIWTASVHLYPLNFLIMSAAFRSMDSSLEEAAWAAGANNLTCLWQITLKVLRPALLSTILILFIRGPRPDRHPGADLCIYHQNLRGCERFPASPWARRGERLDPSLHQCPRGFPVSENDRTEGKLHHDHGKGVPPPNHRPRQGEISRFSRLYPFLHGYPFSPRARFARNFFFTPYGGPHA